MAYNWNWSIFSSVVPTGDTTYLGWMLSGLQTTILLSPILSPHFIDA